MPDPAIRRLDDLASLEDTNAQKMRAVALEKLMSNPAEYLSVYAARFGNVLNADDAATLFDEYNQDRARYRVAVHPAATWIRDELFRRCLADVPTEGKERIVFTAGGNAVGKSSAIEYAQARRWAHVVFDSTFSNFMHARVLVDAALAARWPITVLHIERPLSEAFLSMLDRSAREGRVVGINQMIHSHRGAAETVRSLVDQFLDDQRCDFHFFANSKYGVREGSIELIAPQDYTKTRKELHELLDHEHRAGRIARSVFDRIRGQGA